MLQTQGLRVLRHPSPPWSPGWKGALGCRGRTETQVLWALAMVPCSAGGHGGCGDGDVCNTLSNG